MNVMQCKCMRYKIRVNPVNNNLIMPFWPVNWQGTICNAMRTKYICS